jgi:opacity protein-like surface antigen
MFGLIAAAALLAGAFPAAAADSYREGKWQFQIPITYVESQSLVGQGGSTVDLNGDLGWGFAFGYNYDEHWVLGFEANWIRSGFVANIAADTDGDDVADEFERVGGAFDAGNLQVTGQYNFLAKTTTPFLRANAGLTYIDSNIAAGPPEGVCWWHPWWGYICDFWQPTYDKNTFSYGAAFGIHSDIKDHFYLECSINQLWVDSDRTDTLEFTGYRLNIGWTF